ncbi:PH domain-containing protein [Flavobacterium litorale]|uniref:PH domain-containing protein n=1 Tax=Flavobacterium litorale TaxID=2856519 RepID=A0ABX8VAF5_9FLAO|nr:PH domain-containing protein [Flavobacterium litorale]QYJ67780.1 PH domain-containing protein [Flavobacterium litorale]
MDTVTNNSNDTREGYVNSSIDTLTLPKFETVEFSPLQSAYYKIMLFNVGIVHLLLAIGLGCALYFIKNVQPYWYVLVAFIVVTLAVSLIISRISFKKRGFAFRTHDVIYRRGVLAVSTIIIPYNRIQHVALHEGLLSRKLGLATIEVFTAGGNSSDVEIPGIAKEHAEKIKQLLVGKIVKEQANEA